jgi:hypothetical protein
MERLLLHYEKAPITGKNLHAAIRTYFDEYRPAEAKYFETYASGLVSHLAKYEEYKDYNMDTIEGYCQQAKPCIHKIDKPGLNTSFSQFFILEVLIITFIKTRRQGYAGQLNAADKIIKCLESSTMHS